VGSRVCVVGDPPLGHEDDAEAIGVGERQRVLGPIRVGRLDRLHDEAGRDGPHRVVVSEVEHEQRLRMRHGGPVSAPRGELEMHAAPGISRNTAS
jgi:hypothetical protein